MGQIEVYEWLKEKRELREDKYFSVAEVKHGMKSKGITGRNLDAIKGTLVNLSVYGYLETQMSKDWRNWEMRFRLKKKYVEKKRK